MVDDGGDVFRSLRLDMGRLAYAIAKRGRTHYKKHNGLNC